MLRLLAIACCLFGGCAAYTCTLHEVQPTGWQCLDVGKYSYPCSAKDLQGNSVTGSCYEPVCYHKVTCRQCIEWVKSDTLPNDQAKMLNSVQYKQSIGACY
jgi:hypothetical protein